jgi:type III secretion system YscQ/HrcQ family protein
MNQDPKDTDLNEGAPETEEAEAQVLEEEPAYTPESPSFPAPAPSAEAEESGEEEAEDEEEIPEDVDVEADLVDTAEVEATGQKIVESGRPLVEKAGQLRKESQFVVSQRMASGNLNVGDIEVQLTFDVGDVTLTLRELEGMKEGYTLTTDRPVDEVVSIRANGQLIGRGRLVKVEGRLGVQIEELRRGSLDAAGQ